MFDLFVDKSSPLYSDLLKGYLNYHTGRYGIPPDTFDRRKLDDEPTANSISNRTFRKAIVRTFRNSMSQIDHSLKLENQFDLFGLKSTDGVRYTDGGGGKVSISVLQLSIADLIICIIIDIHNFIPPDFQTL